MSNELLDVGSRPDRPSSRRSGQRQSWVMLVVVVILLLLPVPWRLQVDEQPFARAWTLDGRLAVDGDLLDPPGTWSWLTAGRPPLVVEVLLDATDGTTDSSIDLRHGPSDARPAAVEPAAAALGLRAAGKVVPEDVDAQLFGNVPDLGVIRWARERLALGPSHGLMVAVTTWASASGVDLRGQHVAGTGAIRGDGRIVPIASLHAKAGAARAAGADVFLFPASQADELADFEPGPMRLVAVDDLADATTVLADLAP